MYIMEIHLSIWSHDWFGVWHSLEHEQSMNNHTSLKEKDKTYIKFLMQRNPAALGWPRDGDCYFCSQVADQYVILFIFACS